MNYSIMVQRYAEAYVSFARQRISIQQLVEEVKLLRWTWRENPELIEILKAPGVPFSDKKNLIEKILEQGFSVEVKDFLKYLIEKMRFAIFLEICDYIRLKYEHGDVVNIILSSTFPLELEIVQDIKDRIEKYLMKKVNLYMELDPDLLGGIQIKIGNRILDGSIRHRLEMLKQQLLNI